MPTETNKNQQIAEKSALTPRQRKAIPLLVASPTYTEGIQKAGINRTTLYAWLKQPGFRAELDRERDELVSEAFETLSQNVSKAVEALVGLLDCGDNRQHRQQDGFAVQAECHAVPRHLCRFCSSCSSPRELVATGLAGTGLAVLSIPIAMHLCTSSIGSVTLSFLSALARDGSCR